MALHIERDAGRQQEDSGGGGGGGGGGCSLFLKKTYVLVCGSSVVACLSVGTSSEAGVVIKPVITPPVLVPATISK